MTGRRSPRELTERNPRMILKRAVSRLSIRRCTRVMLDVLLSWSRHHRPTRRCILSILYEPLFSTPGRGSQTHEQYSTWGWTKPTQALAFKVDEFTPKFLLRKQSVRFALAVISSMCRFHLRFVENHTSR